MNKDKCQFYVVIGDSSFVAPVDNNVYINATNKPDYKMIQDEIFRLYKEKAKLGISVGSEIIFLVGSISDSEKASDIINKLRLNGKIQVMRRIEPEIKKEKNNVSIFGLTDSQKAHIIYSLNIYSEKSSCIICSNNMQAKKMMQDLKFFSDKEIVFFPAREIVYYDVEAESKEIENARMYAIEKILSKENIILVTTIDAMLQKCVPINKYKNSSLNFNIGDKVNLDNILNYVNDFAGIRIVCSFLNDLDVLKEIIKSDPDLVIINEKDYVNYPKNSGYRGYHLIVGVPVYSASGKTYVKVELQIRTIAMEMWASLEQKINYHKIASEDAKNELKRLSGVISGIDNNINEIVENSRKNKNAKRLELKKSNN